MNMQKLSRREFVVSTLSAAGGLAIGVSTSADAASLSVRPWGNDALKHSGEINAWVLIEPDDTVIIRYGRAEMGQGSFTALPQILTEELECDWTFVKPEYASANRNHKENKVYGSLSTGGSRAVRETGEMVQQAGASARERLIAAAAKRWNVAATDCKAAMSKVTHTPTGRTFRFGELAAEAALIKLDKEPAIKKADQFKFIGQRIARLDVPHKINGTAIYGIDISVPNMVHAAIIACPVFGGTVKSVDERPIAGARGILQVVKLRDAVAVVADRYFRAKAALDKLAIEWEVGAAGSTDSLQFRKDYITALDQTGAVARHDGNVDAAMPGAAKVIEAVYDAPIIAHAPMEPLNATAHVQGDRVDVWVGTQNADMALTFAAQASGVKPENVYIHNTFSGGGFGRRLRPDEVAQAVAVSKAIGKPVKLLWSREEEIRQGRYRTQAAIRFKAGFDAKGTAIAYDIRNSAGSSNPQAVRNGLDPQTTQGLITTAYKLPNLRVTSIIKNTHVPLGPWRAPGHSQNVFFMESFIDEMALAAGQDPIKFRRSLLAHRADFQQVLDVLESKSDWGKPMPAGKGRGMAIHESYDSIVGMVAEVAVSNGEVKVERVVIACDCGVVVNPRGVETQLEGGMIYGLSAALFGEITVKNGRVVEGNFDTYPVVRLKDAPKTEVYLTPTPGKKWGGVGEPGATMIQPAVTNAIFAATGKRLRSLPIRNHNLSGAA
ncbi:MAG TPA: xanthine dehydrogenase family protein molybdopterin-binding subunit [Xanthobacteraceae bacterium]|jgi:isoquinoline 1-oxidoreductase beta subunit|nr:xanthine dehydrogenase family protein molybdopterin-binding subunit [Xanthobacteraceae bacterium]